VIQVEALDALVADLKATLESGERGKPIIKLLESYARDHDDWRNFALFGPKSYTRNLVASNEQFHLLILCWGPDQVSPIHNHEGQCCWMAVLEGQMQELHYTRPAEVKPGPLEPLQTKLFESGQVAYINDEIALHVVAAAEGTSSVSMHLYSSGYDHCNVYCPDTGKITRKQLSNYSDRGRVL
jgi:cysteine dioxygenase